MNKRQLEFCFQIFPQSAPGEGPEFFHQRFLGPLEPGQWAIERSTGRSLKTASVSFQRSSVPVVGLLG